MCEITTNFRLQLCIDMLLNQPFLVLKQGETCVSGDFLMINSAQAEIVPAKESSNVPESLL